MRDPEKVGEFVARRPDGSEVRVFIWQTFRQEFNMRDGWQDVPNTRKEIITDDDFSVYLVDGQMQIEDGTPLTTDDPRAPSIEQ